MTVADPYLVTEAIRTKLGSVGLAVGNAQAPTGIAPPYVVVYPIAGGTTSGTLAALHDDAEMIYQVTCVGKGWEQAQALEKTVNNALLGVGTITITGRPVPHIDHEGWGGIFRDDTKSPPLFTAVPRFRVFSTPS